MLKFVSCLTIVMTVWSFSGWIGGILSAALLLLGYWWVER